MPWACWPQPCGDTCALVFILAPPHGLAAIATTIPTESLGSCMTTVAQAAREVAGSLLARHLMSSCVPQYSVTDVVSHMFLTGLALRRARVSQRAAQGRCHRQAEDLRHV